MAGAFGKITILIMGAGLLASMASGNAAIWAAVGTVVLLLLYANRLEARDKRDERLASHKPRSPRKGRR